MNYSLSKSRIGADKAQKHRKTEMIPCQDYGQVQMNTDRLRDLEVQCRAHNLLELRGRVWNK
jgi:hypothetical protein